MNRIRHPLIALVVAAIAAIAIAACGDDGGDEDPREVLDATFSAGQEIDSGAFDVSAEISAEGGDNAGTFELTLGGPFQGADGDFPSFDIEAEADLGGAQDFSATLGLTSTGDSGFVNFQGTDYEVPEQAFNQFAQSFTRLQSQSEDQAGEGGGGLLSSLGINPGAWLTDLSNEGREDVEGTETIHISGEADVPKLVEDLKRIAKNAPQAAGEFTPEQLGELDRLTDTIESAEFDIFSGVDDETLRRLEAEVELDPADDDGEDAPESVSLSFSITLSDLNEPQQIAVPSGAQPLSGLLQQLGLDAESLGGLGDALGGGSGSGPGAGGGAPPQAGGAPGGPSDNATQAYLDCLAAAEGADAVQDCADLLEQ